MHINFLHIFQERLGSQALDHLHGLGKSTLTGPLSYLCLIPATCSFVQGLRRANKRDFAKSCGWAHWRRGLRAEGWGSVRGTEEFQDFSLSRSSDFSSRNWFSRFGWRLCPKSQWEFRKWGGNREKLTSQGGKVRCRLVRGHRCCYQRGGSGVLSWAR